MTKATEFLDFQEKLHRAAALAHGAVRKPRGSSYNTLCLAFLLWRRARGNTALREALVLMGALTVAYHARQKAAAGFLSSMQPSNPSTSPTQRQGA